MSSLSSSSSASKKLSVLIKADRLLLYALIVGVYSAW